VSILYYLNYILYFNLSPTLCIFKIFLQMNTFHFPQWYKPSSFPLSIVPYFPLSNEVIIAKHVKTNHLCSKPPYISQSTAKSLHHLPSYLLHCSPDHIMSYQPLSYSFFCRNTRVYLLLKFLSMHLPVSLSYCSPWLEMLSPNIFKLIPLLFMTSFVVRF
jgi:hypothetical protein